MPSTCQTKSAMMLVAALLVAPLLLGACGGGDDDTAAPARGDDSETPVSAETGANRDASEPSDSEASRVPGLGMAATKLRVRLFAEDVEVVGSTIHVYAKERDENTTGEDAECIIAAQEVPEGATVVIHRGGIETTC